MRKYSILHLDKQCGLVILKKDFGFLRKDFSFFKETLAFLEEEYHNEIKVAQIAR